MEKSTKNVVFWKIGTNLKPRKFVQSLGKSVQIDHQEKVAPGEIVKFELPVGPNINLGFVGKKPEKFEVVGDKLTVVMTECVLVHIRKDVNNVSRLDVINAL
jgi:hypothetical protein